MASLFIFKEKWSIFKHWWFSGRILACLAGDRGSIPRQWQLSTDIVLIATNNEIDKLSIIIPKCFISSIVETLKPFNSL